MNRTDKNQTPSHSHEDDSHEQHQRILHFILESVSKRYLVLVGISFFAVLLTVITHFLYLPAFEAKSIVRVQLEQKVSVPMLLASQAGAEVISDSQEMARHIRYLWSDTFLNALGEELKTLPEIGEMNFADPKKIPYFSRGYWDRYFARINPSVDHLSGSLDSMTVAGKAASLIQIEVSTSELIVFTAQSLDPNTAKKVANLYATVFAKLNQQANSEQIVEVEKFIRRKLDEVQARLKSNAALMIDLKEKNHLYASEGNVLGGSGQVSEIDRKLSELWIQESEKENNLKRYEDLADAASVASGNEKALHDFRLDELKKKSVDLEIQKSRLQRLSKKAQSRFSKLPRAEQEYLTLKHQEAIDYEIYSALAQKLNQLEIEKYSIAKKINIETLSKEAGQVQRVNFILKILYAFFTSLFFGIALILGLEKMDPTVKNLEEFKISRIENIGIIPKVSPAGTPDSTQTEALEAVDRQDLSKLVVRNHPRSLEAMAFKYVRARLQQILNENGSHSKVLLISSASGGDGKSFVASNLAVCFAQLGKKTLLIDTDFRNPTVSRFFEIPNLKGLASVLQGRESTNDVIVQDPFVPMLSILPAENDVDHPTELLSGGEITALLDRLKDSYDYILIDSPPIQIAVDALVLSPIASTVLVVGRYRKTLKRHLAKTYRDLVSVNFQKIYGVLNGVENSGLLRFFDQQGTPYRGSYYAYEKIREVSASRNANRARAHLTSIRKD